MGQPQYSWNVRGADPGLIRRLRIVAFRREVAVGVVLNEAIRRYLDVEDVPVETMADEENHHDVAAVLKS